MRASDIVLAITDALNRKHSKKPGRLEHPPSAYVTAVVVPRGGQVEVDADVLGSLGISVLKEVAASVDEVDGSAAYDPEELVATIATVVFESMDYQLDGGGGGN